MNIARNTYDPMIGSFLNRFERLDNESYIRLKIKEKQQVYRNLKKISYKTKGLTIEILRKVRNHIIFHKNNYK